MCIRDSTRMDLDECAVIVKAKGGSLMAWDGEKWGPKPWKDWHKDWYADDKAPNIPLQQFVVDILGSLVRSIGAVYSVGKNICVGGQSYVCQWAKQFVAVVRAICVQARVAALAATANAALDAARAAKPTEPVAAEPGAEVENQNPTEPVAVVPEAEVEAPNPTEPDAPVAAEAEPNVAASATVVVVAVGTEATASTAVEADLWQWACS